MSGIKRGRGYSFLPVMACIYCGDRETKLGDEHIIPYGLGGDWLLPKASCTACARLTLQYEGVTSRTTLGNLRMRHGFPTRRKKERPTTIEIGTVDAAGRPGRKAIPVSEYPVGAFIPHFGRAGIMVGAPPALDIMQFTVTNYTNDDIDEFKAKHNWDGRVRTELRPIEFGQMIIKIAYSHAVGVMGMGAFEPLCLDQILLRTKNISYVFGQSGKNEAVKGESALWTVDLSFEAHAGSFLVLSHISFLPNMGTPIYEVAVGRILTDEQIYKMNVLLKDGFNEVERKRRLTHVKQIVQS